MKIIDLNNDENIAIIGDLHFDNRTINSRIDDLLITANNKLKDIFIKCQQHNVKIVIFQGDVFNRNQISYEALNLFTNNLMHFKNLNSDLQIYSIIGNHDMFRNSIDLMQKTPLQLLFNSGIIEHICLENKLQVNIKNESSKIKKLLITPVDYIEYPPEADANFDINILIAHMFYNKSDAVSNSGHNLKNNEVKNLNYDFIFLGHDHEEYPPESINKTILYRQGAVIRGTSHNYNFERKPCFLILKNLYNLSQNSIEKIHITCQNYKDVVRSFIANKKDLNLKNIMQENLKYLADKLTILPKTYENNIISKIENDINLSTNCKEILLHYINEN